MHGVSKSAGDMSSEGTITAVLILTLTVCSHVAGYGFRGDDGGLADTMDVTFSNIRGIPRDEPSGPLGIDNGGNEANLGSADLSDDVTFGFGSDQPLGFDDNRRGVVLGTSDVFDDVQFTENNPQDQPMGFDDEPKHIVLSSDDVLRDISFSDANNNKDEALGFDDQGKDAFSFTNVGKDEPLGFDNQGYVLGEHNIDNDIKFTFEDGYPEGGPLGFDQGGSHKATKMTNDNVADDVQFTYDKAHNNDNGGGRLGFDQDNSYTGSKMTKNDVVDDVEFTLDNAHHNWNIGSGSRGTIINMEGVDDQTIFNEDKGTKVGYDKNGNIDCATINRKCECSRGGRGGKGGRRGKGGLGADETDSVGDPPDYSTNYN